MRETSILQSFLVAAGIALSADALGAENLAKEKLLSPGEEKQWIDAVKNRKVNDGATVWQALKYSEQMRPRQFKVQAIDVGYNGATGEPEFVAITYWIGMKRLDGDAWIGFFYNVKRNGSSLEVEVPENPIPQFPTMTEAMELGRDSFLTYIDNMYREVCIDFETKKRLC